MSRVITETDRAKMSAIIDQVCDRYQVRRQALLSHSRERVLAWPRQEAMHQCFEAGVSRPTIGAMFNRDQTTVYFASKSVAKRGGIVLT